MNVQQIDGYYPKRNTIVRDAYRFRIDTLGTMILNMSDFIGYFENSSGKIQRMSLGLGEYYDNEIRACFEI